jgi:hypothetical protein
MLPSVEARWFIRGEAPKEALDWIQRWELGPSEPEKREDHYLRFPDIASIGVKLREGKFEVKRRDLDLGLVALGSRVTGRLSLWRKWGFKIVDDGSNKAPDGHWITTEKKRFLRKYSKEQSGLLPVDPKSFPARGCTVELTALRVRGAEWWSVGFEAFGPDESELRNTLTLAAEKCFNTGIYPALDRKDSFDYPEWLASLGE